MIPLTRIPRIMVIQLVENAVLWLNTSPLNNSLSSKYSPRRIISGFEISYSKHVKNLFGKYVQTHENHSNDMSQQSMGVVYLGPTGNR